jgi:hypothetical protein
MIELFEDDHFIRYRLDGEVHRANGPAIIWKNNGEWVWRMRGTRHRYYGPTNSYGTGNWCIHDRIIKYDIW